MYEIKIVPSSVLGENFNVLRIREVQVNLYKNAYVSWQAINSVTMSVVASGKIEIPEVDYADWGKSDDYVVNKILEKMGLEAN